MAATDYKKIANLKGPQGKIGPTGKSTKLTVGATETVASGAPAEVSIHGEAPNQVIDFKIPRGLSDPGVPITDDTVGGLIGTEGTIARAQVDAAVKRLTRDTMRLLIVEDFYQFGDTDDQTWQRTVDHAIATGGKCRILGTKLDYRFVIGVDLTGLKTAVIAGLGKFSTQIRAAEGAGEILAAFHVPVVMTGEVLESVTFEGIRFDGNMIGVFTAHARPKRDIPANFGADRILTAVYLNGNLIPTEPNNATIDRVRFVDCSFFGLQQLPIHIRGVKNVALKDCYLWRCLDPGWVHCKSVYATTNQVDWSADNGLSLSRGCEQVFAVENDIMGAYFAGIHTGGWDGEAGASRVVVTGNIVRNSGMYGISLLDGTTYAKVTNNIIDGVLRGIDTWGTDSSSVQYGAGILIGGVVSDGTKMNSKDGYSKLAAHNDITNNLIMNAERFGIVWYGAIDNDILANHVYNCGSATMLDGTAIEASNDWRNVAIGPYIPWASSQSGHKIKLNTVIEDRATPGTNWGILNSGGAEAFGNSVTGARNVYGETWGTNLGAAQWRVGSSTAADAILYMRGAAGSTRSIVFQSGTVSDWSIRESGTKALEFYNYATAKAPFKLGNDGSVQMDIPTISGVSSNLYLDSNGALRKIV